MAKQTRTKKSQLVDPIDLGKLAFLTWATKKRYGAFEPHPSYHNVVESIREHAPDENEDRVEFLRTFARELTNDADTDQFNFAIGGRKQIRRYASVVNRAADVLDRCGENPTGTFAEVRERIETMPYDQRSRYVDGLTAARGMSTDGWEILRTMLPGSRSHPFQSWTEREWKELEALADDPEPASDKLYWKGSHGDLVAVVDALKQAGLLDKGTTDAAIIQHFEYGSKANNPRDTYRKTRDKLNAGQTHITEKVKQLIELLQKLEQRG